jgi:hypothetical protein
MVIKPSRLPNGAESFYYYDEYGKIIRLVCKNTEALYEYDETGKLIKIRKRDLTTGRESIRYM